MFDSSEERVIKKRPYAPTDDDFVLTNVGISEAENGVVIECSYDLKEDVKEKMRKNQQSTYGPYCYDGSGYKRDKHVFEDKPAALTFITGELNKMWQSGNGD